jgi:hypothetical protein
MAAITYDLIEGEPKAGDVIGSVSTRTRDWTGTWYAILGVREVRQRDDRPFRRWRLFVERIVDLAGVSPLVTVWPIRWYHRGERP